MNNTITRIEISSKTIILVLSYILGLWFLFQIRSIIITVFVAFILMTAIRPIAKLALKVKIPTLIVVAFFFIMIMSIMTTLVVSLIPAVMDETLGLLQNIPEYLAFLQKSWGITLNPDFFTTQLSGIPTNLLSLAAGAFGNILTIMAIFFITYYLLIERENLHKYLTRFFIKENKENLASKFIDDVEVKVGGWVRGELFLMLIIGLMTYAGLLLLHIPYALPLAVLAGLLEAVPNLGPTIAAVPAVLIGLTISPVTALGALAMSILIQQLENNIIVPKIMQSTTGVDPLVTMLVLMVGFALGGIIGAVLAMPIYLAVNSLHFHIN